MATEYVVEGKAVIQGASSKAEALEIAENAVVDWVCVGAQQSRHLTARQRTWAMANTTLGVSGVGLAAITYLT